MRHTYCALQIISFKKPKTKNEWQKSNAIKTNVCFFRAHSRKDMLKLKHFKSRNHRQLNLGRLATTTRIEDFCCIIQFLRENIL